MPDTIDLPDLTLLPDRALVALYGAVMAELLDRGVVRSGNNPIADMAERVVADYYGVEPAPPNEKAYDVKTKGGDRIQVKALRRTRPNSSSLSPLRDLDQDLGLSPPQRLQEAPRRRARHTHRARGSSPRVGRHACC